VAGRYFLTTLAVTLGVLLGVVWVYTARFPGFYLSPGYGAWQAKFELAVARPAQSVCILGDSRAMTDLIPARIGAKVLNFGLVGTKPIEGYFMAGRLSADAAPIQAVVISYEPFHFTIAGEELASVWGAAKYGLLKGRELEEIREQARIVRDPAIFQSPTPFDIDARLKIWLLSHWFPSYYILDLISGRVAGWRNENLAEISTTLDTRGYVPVPVRPANKVVPQGGQWFKTRGGAAASMRPLGWAPAELHARVSDFARTEADLVDENAEMPGFSPAPIIDFYFRQTLELFPKEGVPVYFVSMPVNDLTLRAMSPKVRAGFASYLDGCAKAYPGFHILGEAVTSLPVVYFHDKQHLNFDGAALESERVRKLLAQASVNCGPADPDWSPAP